MNKILFFLIATCLPMSSSMGMYYLTNVRLRIPTKLHKAAAEGRINACEQLLKNGHALDQPDFEENTPLHVAACKGHYAICQLLIAHGADRTARNINFKVPFDLIPESSDSEESDDSLWNKKYQAFRDFQDLLRPPMKLKTRSKPTQVVNNQKQFEHQGSSSDDDESNTTVESEKHNASKTPLCVIHLKTLLASERNAARKQMLDDILEINTIMGDEEPEMRNEQRLDEKRVSNTGKYSVDSRDFTTDPRSCSVSKREIEKKQKVNSILESFSPLV